MALQPLEAKAALPCNLWMYGSCKVTVRGHSAADVTTATTILPYLNVDHKICGQQTSKGNLPPRKLWRHHQIKGLLRVKQCVLDLPWVDYGSQHQSHSCYGVHNDCYEAQRT